MSVKFHEAYALDSQQDQLLWWDDFLGDQLQDEWRAVLGAGTVAVVDQQTGGIVRITTGALTGNATYIDWADIRSLHVTRRISWEFRLKLSSTTAVNLFLSLQFDGGNRIYFYRSAANWQIRTTDGGVPSNFDSGVAPDTSYHIFRIECHTHGASHAHFYIDGTETANSPITTNIPDDATDYFQPFFYLITQEDVAKSMDIDYCVVRQDV